MTDSTISVTILLDNEEKCSRIGILFDNSKKLSHYFTPLPTIILFEIFLLITARSAISDDIMECGSGWKERNPIQIKNSPL
jgi:hypothetical protein